MKEPLYFLFTIYFHPADYPDRVVVRPFTIDGQPVPVCCLCDTLEEARQPFGAAGLVCFARAAKDDPVIVETWL